MGEERVAFFQSVLGTMSIYLNNPALGERDQTPSVVILYGSQNNKYPYMHALSSMTSEELDHYDEFVNLAIRLARPVVAERDKIAQECLEEGDDSYGRVYRQSPRTVVRPRLLGPDDHSIFNKLIELLRTSKHVMLDANNFKNRRQEMNFWDDEEDSDSAAF